MTLPGDEKPLIMDPKEELPSSVQEEFTNISEPQEDIRVAVTSDMNLDGEFEDAYLLATNKRILVFSGNHVRHPELLNEISLADVSEVKLKNYVGNGILEVETADKSVELLRFSKTAFHKNDISGVPKAIDGLREEVGLVVEKRKDHGGDENREKGRGRRCEKCGETIPRWTDTCPNCLEKRALLLRLFGYLKPYWYVAVIAFLLSVITVGLGRLVPPLITKELMDKVFSPVLPPAGCPFHRARRR